MELCFVYDAVHPWETGGVQKRVWEVARRLADDHDVHWYGLKYWDGASTMEREGITFHGVAPEQKLYVNDRRSIGEALRFSAALVRPLLGANPDVVDCQAFPYFPSFPSKLQSVVRDATFFVTWHEVWDDYWYEYLGRKGAFGRAVERVTARLADQHVVVSERTRRDLAGIGVNGSHLVPNGVDAAAIEAVDPVDDPVDLFFAGRLTPDKNPELVVHAVDELRDSWPDVRCVVAGEGPLAADVERLVTSLGLEGNVRLPGFLPEHGDVLAHMAAADAFVLPSQREGFGITVLEALASGTPVVTVDHPRNAATELVAGGETGFVVDRDAEGIAAAVRRARQEIAAADCLDAARDYDWDRIAEQAEQTYLNALAGS